jgi:hypothetical protein
MYTHGSIPLRDLCIELRTKSASGPAAAAAAVTTDPGLVQPAAMPAATPPQAWALEKRDGLVLMARRL